MSPNFLRPAVAMAFALALAACSTPGAPPTTARSAASRQAMVAAIRAAGARDESVINVSALPDPALATLRDSAQADERAGRLQAAAASLDKALQANPESPDLLQQRAELAVLLGDDARAAKLARQSWEIGPRLGPLCARNWQTLVELRQLAGDEPGAEQARRQVQGCREAGVPRY